MTEQRKAWIVHWRTTRNKYDRETLYLLAYDEVEALERARAYVKREFNVRQPVIIDMRHWVEYDQRWAEVTQ